MYVLGTRIQCLGLFQQPLPIELGDDSEFAKSRSEYSGHLTNDSEFAKSRSEYSGHLTNAG